MSVKVSSQRIQSIDALRGFALAGVVIVHMIEQYLAGPPPPGFLEGINGLPDQILQGLVQFFFSGKFFALFSVLFGLSFFLQMESADKKGINFGGRFLWRALLLFGIGYAHQLFYRGDILTIYAVLAPFLIPFYKVPTKWILTTAVFIILGFPRILSFYVFGGESVTGIHPMMDTENPQILAYYDTIQNGTIWEVFKANAGYGMLTKIDFQLSIFGRFYYTFAYFLIGLWLGRIGVFQHIEQYAKKIKDFMLWSVVVALVSVVITAAVFASAGQPVDPGSFLFMLGMNFMDWINLAMASIILCGFLLLYKNIKWEKRLLYFAPFGRMALTNYFFQSVIGTFILFGWGLGMFGQIRNLYMFLIALAVIILQTAFSKFWLKKFRYGPLEWLWRSATHLKRQPFLIDKKRSELATG